MLATTATCFSWTEASRLPLLTVFFLCLRTADQVHLPPGHYSCGWQRADQCQSGQGGSLLHTHCQGKLRNAQDVLAACCARIGSGSACDGDHPRGTSAASGTGAIKRLDRLEDGT